MNPDFNRLLSASAADRLGLFLATAARLGTTVQNVEKDFWVCWTLDALFNGLQPGGPRLLFKGGTSLSKGYGLIERFSEDIDITVFRADIDAPASVEKLEALGRKQRDKQLEAIRTACQTFIGGPLKTQLEELAASLPSIGGPLRVELDADDADGQSLLLRYPAVSDEDGYVRPAVKIEAGAKSALDPHEPLSIRPYVAGELTDFDLTVLNVTTINPVRTFWDKVLILHSLRRSFEDRGRLRGGGQRVSRHYYDVDRVLRTEIGRRAVADLAMAEDCVRHERMFFKRPGQDTAVPGSFALVPPPAMLSQVRLDYEAMQVMIFGEVPAFDAVMDSIAALEDTVNRRAEA
ncbi:MAG: nucleotidyl transferase AbiEii/AbiGii toxin family protein [Alphaproteobacteria bacterium]|nr:nucleotidyl transferase AbiEii/AbiGii toxin family protein [Alphaproteobacteria bacterium]